MLKGLLPDFITQEPPEFPDHIILKESKRARRLSLRLNIKTGQFDLTIPYGYSLYEAHKFVQSQQSWIDMQLAKLPEGTPFHDGQTLSIMGTPRLIQIKENPTSARTKISLDEQTLTMLTHLEDPAPRLEKYLKTLAKEKLSALAHIKAKQINKVVTSITVRDTKSRWGSCSEDGKIMFSWRLIFAPYAAIDYVVAHEVAHLTHMDHSKPFWSLCRDLSDDFIEGSHWMREHGSSLHRIGHSCTAA